MSLNRCKTVGLCVKFLYLNQYTLTLKRGVAACMNLKTNPVIMTLEKDVCF